MPSIRITVDLAFPIDESGKMDTKTQEIHDLLLDVTTKAKKLAREVVSGSLESTVSAKRHICRHDIGLPCTEEELLGDDARCVKDARKAKIVLDAEAGIAAGKVK